MYLNKIICLNIIKPSQQGQISKYSCRPTLSTRMPLNDIPIHLNSPQTNLPKFGPPETNKRTFDFTSNLKLKFFLLV